MQLIKPKEITILNTENLEKNYIISKFPAIIGREIYAKYPMTGLPKIGDYSENEATMLKLMSYVAVPTESGTPLRFTTRQLIENHIESWETLIKIEKEMLVYNFSFFQNGQTSDLFAGLAQKALAWIIKTSTDLQPPLSPKS